MTNEIKRILFQQMCEKAIKQSQEHECVQHVNAIVGFDNMDNPIIDGYYVSDWTDGSTLRTYYRGELQ